MLVRALGLEQRVLTRPLALHVAGSWAIRAAARQGASHAADFSRSTHLEQLRRIESALSRKRESEKTRARALFFPVPTVYAQQRRQCRSGLQRRGPHEELHHKVEGRGAWRSVSASIRSCSRLRQCPSGREL